ncbi:MAG TPA: molybdenum cofactor guanylyltransferase [Methanoregula sp.]|nr:molybdenum cofactor guanylyltransferase [Methanoregula sp.]
MRSAVILVGGEARRANGQEKYFFRYQGRTFIERLVDTLRGIVDEIILVARDPEQCRRFDHLSGVRCITDIRQGIGPIGGLHAGTLAAQGDLLFVSACDMPCIEAGVVSYLFSAIGNHQAAIPSWNEDLLEPLMAVYRRDAILDYLKTHESYSLRPMIRSIDTLYVPVNDLRQFDTDLRSFTNINKLEDLEQINGDASP